MTSLITNNPNPALSAEREADGIADVFRPKLALNPKYIQGARPRRTVPHTAATLVPVSFIVPTFYSAILRKS